MIEIFELVSICAAAKKPNATQPGGLAGIKAHTPHRVTALGVILSNRCLSITLISGFYQEVPR